MTIQRLERHNGENSFPLSASQEQLWYLYQLAPASSAYNVMDFISLQGPYNAQALRKVAAELVQRHETLRTAFSQVNGQPMQVVMPGAELEILEFDLTSLPQAERETEWVRLVHEQTQKPFDLSQAPLIRWSVIHLTAEEHKLVVVIHHIITDEWSMGILHKEVTQLYQDFSQGKPSSLAELPIQYADFAGWQKEWFQGEVQEKQLTYWKNELAGAPQVLELTTDKPRPAIQSFRGAWESLHLPVTVLTPLKALSRQERTTLYMTLLAGFMAVLYRYTGQEDILVGTPISLRKQSETENLIGYLLGTVIVRAQFKDDLSFRTLLQQVRKRALGAYVHSDLPLNSLVAALTPERDMSRTPLFQVMFIMNDAGGVFATTKASDAHLLETGTSKFDLSLLVSETKTGLDVSFEYSTDLFEPETIRQLGQHFGTLLEAIGSNPDQSISKLALLASSERQKLLHEWNDTATEYPKDVPLAQLVEAQVRRTPDSVAVVHGSEHLTYRQLNERANRLAQRLIKQGVQPEQVVGVFIERSTDLVVALLAIIKTGAAYLPMDPLFPPDRLGYMLEDSGAQLLVTQQSLLKDLPAFAGSSILMEDQDWQSNPTDNPAVAVGPENLAYLMYTSGSTGKPKGVQIPRGALTNFLWSMREWLKLGESDRLLAVTTISFDIAGLEVWLPLLVGSQIVVASREAATDGVALRALIDKHDITIMQATPVTWRLLFESGWKGKRGMQAICGGEAMPQEVADQLVPAVGRVWNLYGPTETTIWSTGYLITDPSKPILIGKPLANTQCYILDGRGQPVPVGVTGELYIAGDGLARGYLHRPELTAEKFVADPFAGNGARMYRTGDLARYRADGNIECLGRVDHQVKLRGYRIELGEIEAVLKSWPGIKQAVVIVREDAPGDKRLAAYYTSAPSNSSTDGAIATDQLRAHLSASLPDYMIPSAYVRMDTLPLTPNGKLDRKALPAPEADSYSSRSYEPPQGDLETNLAAIWAEVLKLDRVGRHDNFFELGGHSLTAVQLISQLQQIAPGDPVPLRAVLEAPTVERFAIWLENRNGNQEQIVVRVRPGKPSRPAFFCVHGAGGNVLSLRPLAMALPADLPIYFLQAKGLDGSQPFETVEETAQCYVEEIRKVQPHGPYCLGGGCYGALVALEMGRILGRMGESVAPVIMIDVLNPIFGASLSKVERLSRNAKFFGRRGSLHSRKMLNMPAGEWAKYTRGRVKALNKYLRSLAGGRIESDVNGFVADQDFENARSAAVGTHLGEILERVGRASRIAQARYVPKPYRGDALIVLSSERKVTPYDDDFLGWKPIVQGSIDRLEIKGDHITIFEEPAVHGMAGKIDATLRKSHAEANSMPISA